MDNTGPPWRVLSVEDDNFQRWFNDYPPEGMVGLPDGFNLEYRKGDTIFYGEFALLAQEMDIKDEWEEE